MTSRQNNEQQKKEFYNTVKDLSTEELSAKLEEVTTHARHNVSVMTWLDKKITEESEKASQIAMKYEVITKLLISRKQR